MSEEFFYKPTECPHTCPKCNSEKITEDDQHYGDNYIIRIYGCVECGFTWEEDYRFLNWKPKEDGQ